MLNMVIKYVFLGTSKFAAIILEELIQAGLPPTLVICNPDRPAGRKKIITSPPVKLIMEKAKLITRVSQPETFSPSFIAQLSAVNADLFIVAAYAKIIPKAILKIPRLGIIGIHPSLLPKYRGPTPIQNAILNGDVETGVTLFLLDEKIDHGPIIANAKFPMLNPKITYQELYDELAKLGAKLLMETLPKFIKNEIKPLQQDESLATYTHKFSTQDAFVDLNKDAADLIIKKIRALNPEPGVWTILNGQRTKILDAELIDGKLKLKKIQVAGKKPIIPM